MNKKLSGKKLRKKREELATFDSFARRETSSTRTITFPLEIPKSVDHRELAQRAQALSQTINGTGKGTLRGLLFAVHLAGFSVLDSTSAVAIAQATIPESEEGAFAVDFEKEFNTKPGKMGVKAFMEFFKKRQRKVKDYNEEEIFEKLQGAFLSQSLRKNGAVVSLFKQITHALQKENDSWEEHFGNAEKNLGIVEDAFAAKSIRLPLVDNFIRSESSSYNTGMSTLHFDESLMQADSLDPGDMSIHTVVAQKLKAIGSIDVEQCKNMITCAGNNNSGLSWLFGKTAKTYFTETDTSQILSDFCIPEKHRKTIDSLKEYFDIPQDEVFGRSYSDYRTMVGGRINSWVANYLKRLELIQGFVQEEKTLVLPELLFDESMEEPLKNIGFTIHDVQAGLNKIYAKRAALRESLNRLAGAGDLPTPTDLARIDNFNETTMAVKAMIEQINARLKQKADFKDIAKDTFDKSAILVPYWLSNMEKINSDRSEIQDPLDELDRAAKKFSFMATNMTLFAEELLEQSTMNSLDAREAIEEERIADRRNKTVAFEFSAREQAIRWVWMGVFRLGIVGSEWLAHQVIEISEEARVIRKRDLNKIIWKREGTFYKSPFSTRKHHPYSMLKAADPLEAFAKLFAATQQRMTQKPCAESIRDHYLVTKQLYAEKLQSIPHFVSIPKKWKTIFLDEKKFKLHPRIKLQLNGDSVPKATAINLFNLFHSEITGTSHVLFRDKFFTRTVFQHTGKNDFVYAPKDQEWKPPKQAFSSDKPIGEALKAIDAQVVEFKSAEATLRQKINPTDATPYTAFLSQFPHDWYIDTRIMLDEPQEVFGAKVDKKTVARFTLKHASPMRLIGTSSLKSDLERMLRDPLVKFGDYKLQFESNYTQKISVSSEGISTEVSFDSLRIVVGAPVEKTNPPAEAFPLGERFVAIDLGEVGIGWAVFDARTRELIKSGTTRIKSIRRLINDVSSKRKQKWPRQKFGMRYDNSLQKLRKNVVGDVLHVIDNLCFEYEAFPVLEHEVRNLASGGKQLELVYDQVVNSYAYSGTDAHKNLRKNHWCGGLNWEHPFLMTINKENEDEAVPLKLYPGVTIGAAHTSQVCSECGRNAKKEFFDHVQNAPSVELGKDGGLDVASGRLLFMRKFGDDQEESEMRFKLFRSRGERVPFSFPEKGGSYNVGKLKMALANYMRQPNKSLRSKDTKQSVYNCPYADCQHVMHADENAAINIGRKWATQKLAESGEIV